MTRLKFSGKYFILTLLLFLIEFAIGKWAHDNFVRPYLGDFLIVMFLYCLIKSFIQLPVTTTAIAVLVISYSAEGLQYINILDIMGWRQSAIANVVLGNWFEWTDIVAYSLGVIVTVIIEQLANSKRSQTQLFV